MAFNLMGTTMGFKKISWDNLGYNMIYHDITPAMVKATH